MATKSKKGQKTAIKRKAHSDAIKKAKGDVERIKCMAGHPPAYTNPELYAWRLAEYMWTQAESSPSGVITIMGIKRALGVGKDTWLEYESGKKDIYSRPVYDSTGARRQSREPERLVDKYIGIYRQRHFLYPYYLYITTGVLPPADWEIALSDLPILDSDTLEICTIHEDGTRDSKAVSDSEYIGDHTAQHTESDTGAQRHTSDGEHTQEQARAEWGKFLWYSELSKHARALLGEDVERRLAVHGKVGDIMRAKVLLGWQDERTETRRIEIASKEDSKRALEELKLLK